MVSHFRLWVDWLILLLQALCLVRLGERGRQTVLVTSALSLDHFVWKTDFVGPSRNRRLGPGALTTETGIRDKATGESRLISIWHDGGYFVTNAKLQFHPSLQNVKAALSSVTASICHAAWWEHVSTSTCPEWLGEQRIPLLFTLDLCINRSFPLGVQAWMPWCSCLE